MAKDESFDVVSEFDQPELLNAVDQTKRDIQARFDLKDSGSLIELEGTKTITITTKEIRRTRKKIQLAETTG